MYLWTSVTPQQMKMRQRVRKALCSNETLSRYSVERQNEDGGGVESGFGGGGRGLELEGTDGAGARAAGAPWGASGLQPLPRAGAAKGPGAGDIAGPQGSGDRKQRPPQTTRPEGGAGDNPQE